MYHCLIPDPATLGIGVDDSGSQEPLPDAGLGRGLHRQWAGGQVEGGLRAISAAGTGDVHTQLTDVKSDGLWVGEGQSDEPEPGKSVVAGRLTRPQRGCPGEGQASSLQVRGRKPWTQSEGPKFPS